MEFATKPGTIIKLDNGKEFIVLENIEYNNEAYLYLTKTVETPEEIFNTNIPKVTFSKEINENGVVRIEEVTDRAKIEQLAKLIKDFRF